MDIQKIKELALASGFSLKEQASGNMDLHSYVYEFAQAVAAEAKASAVPDGFVLVPKECSDEMAEIIAITAKVCGGIAGDIYDAIPANLSGNASRYILSSAREGIRSEKVRKLIPDMLSSYTVNIAYHANNPDVGMSLEKGCRTI